jgi:hypothetical protein
MRNGLLTLLGILVVGATVAQAQPAPPSAAPPPDPGRFGHPWDRGWEALLMSAAAPDPGAQPPAPPPQPAEPESPANRAWFGVDYLLWWSKNGPLPTPLVTTGPASVTIPGGLTEPGTQVLYGGSDLDFGLASGLHAEAGLWLDGEHQWGLEAEGFFLEQRSTGFSAHSTTSGSPVLAQPLINPATGQEFTEVVALPGLIAGGIAVTTHSLLRGWEVNGLANVWRGEGFNIDLLAGLRAARLDEDLESFSAFAPLANGFLTFQGRSVTKADTLSTLDTFEAQNQFYGIQVGARAEWVSGALTVGGFGKVALGGTQELVRIAGESSLAAPGAAVLTVPGGVLAVSSNSGRHFRDEFAALPEVGLRVSYRLSRRIEAHMGYSFLYLSRVARPGNQVSRSIEPGLIPTDAAFGTPTATPPSFQLRSSDYWAQGLNFGLEFHF